MSKIEKLRAVVIRKLDTKEVSQVTLSRDTGVDQSSLSRFRKGEGLSAENFIKLAEWIGWTIEDEPKKGIIRHMGANSPEIATDMGDVAPVAVYAVAGAGPAWDIQAATPLFSITAPSSFAKQSRHALLVDGESMYPTIKNGAVVGISDDTQLRQNEVFAVNIPYEGLTVKRVSVDHGTGEYVLRSDNPDKEKYDDIRIKIEEAPFLLVGRVVWVWQKV